MKKIVKQCEKIPHFYGTAYRNWEKGYAVAYPIPLNIIIRYLFGLYCLIRLIFKNPIQAELNFKEWIGRP